MAQLPTVRFTSHQLVLKGEDVVLVEPRNRLPGTEESAPQWDLPYDLSHDNSHGVRTSGEVQSARCDFGVYAVFDGHNGTAAAVHCRDVFLRLLLEQLPPGLPPVEADTEAFEAWRQELQRALAVAFAQAQHTFAAKGVEAGTTATVVLQTGWLVTCANVGDSLGFIDTGSEVLPLTMDHRIDTNLREQQRVTASGGLITNVDRSGHGPATDPLRGMGQLRIWPGGMANARAIGDFGAGHLLVSSPHITQVLIPAGSSARVVIASDGVWDSFDTQGRVAKLMRKASPVVAAGKVLNAIQRLQDHLKDDTSVVVVDIEPAGFDRSQTMSTDKSSLSRITSAAGLSSVSSFGRLKSSNEGSVHSRDGSFKAGGSFGRSASGSGSGRSGGCCMSASRTLDDEPSAKPAPLQQQPAVDPSASANPSVRSNRAGAPRLRVYPDVDVADLLDQMPSKRSLQHTVSWPAEKLSSALNDTQLEAHSIFSRAAIQRLSITQYPPLSRGGSSSLLSLLATEADERSVRRGQLAPAIERNYQNDITMRRGAQMLSLLEDEALASPHADAEPSPGASPNASEQSTLMAGSSTESLLAGAAAGAEHFGQNPNLDSFRSSPGSSPDLRGEGLLDRGSGDGMEGSVRFSVDSTVRSGVDGSVRIAGAPLKSALKSSTSKRPVQKTALQQSAGLREPQR